MQSLIPTETQMKLTNFYTLWTDPGERNGKRLLKIWIFQKAVDKAWPLFRKLSNGKPLKQYTNACQNTSNTATLC